MSNVLITGGAGFLGWHLGKSLSDQGWQVTLADILPLNQNHLPANCRFEIADVRDNALMEQLLTRQNFIVHAAAALPLWKRADIFSTNVDGTRNVCAAALKHGVQRLVMISSTAVYGVPEKHPIEEDDPLIGVGPYGKSKIAAEAICREYLAKGLNVTVLRPKTFLGTGRLGVFEILFDWVHDGRKIPVIGSGKNRYQLLAVDDLVAAVGFLLTEGKPEYNDVFNIAAREFGMVEEDLFALAEFAGSGSRVLATPAGLVKAALRFLEFLRLSPLYQWVYDTADKDSFVAIDKLTRVLNWTPKYSNAQILIKTYDWYLKNYSQIKSQTSGITHTAAWKQGALAVIKRLM